ncbi:hydantoinase/oxoprolinase family protein [Nitratireductor aquimarinus]|uniref:hydantoinase/oxoprolinase family protein n=1 Tax=Nitratireductor aquimarinus TaxID=889300 RepID=UPI001A902CAB|nr:hydantoinase/oxoprolinase family protein [Nitratireductor aquimarinus]MBN8245679.1 hydantoinase/oxoprolinase family protein [Nitratireductor aquimarinus]MBY6134062.1 hydantoinase/oxoprolinase family protein [Nitratireductor aquimarinus]MCA1305158.1 hydantoinase/oxoprolinase family protein [Nitratireductor aquimarinus]
MAGRETAGNRIGVEIGGTFTDMVWADAEGVLHSGKTPSTPKAIHEAVLNVVGEAGIDLAGIEQVTHGSTIATNALIMRKGSATGLLTTSGFRDVVILGRADRDHDIYNMRYVHPAPPIRRGMIREVSERIGPDGSVIAALDLEQAWREVEAFLRQGVEGIAISLLHAYANPAHEKALAAMIRERAPQVAVFASHEVSPEFREYERSVTTVVNAFVGPAVKAYIDRLDSGLRERGYDGVLRIMQSNGGVMPAAAAGDNAVRMLLSGPAAGVRAAIWFAARNSVSDIITLDMGGTSTDVAIAPGLVASTVTELKIDGLPIRTSVVDMGTIGAGGGSIASIDRGGFLSVGPESAGALPGPVCYGRGGERPTVTDAQVVAGLLQPDNFFGGRMTLATDAARDALAGLGLQGGPEAAADSILRIVNSNMAGAVRLISTSRGIDPRDFTLVAFGGGGPLHAAMVARELGVRRVLVPWSPGIASAFGLLIADTMIDAAVSDLHSLAETSLDADRIEALSGRAELVARENGLAADAYQLSIGVDMRYAGQAFELTIWTDATPHEPAALRDLFEVEHRSRYGYARAALGVEVVSYRIRIVARSGIDVETPLPDGAGATSHPIEIAIDGRRVPGVSLSRGTLLPGMKLEGPAVLGEPTSTTFVPPGWEVECLPSGDLMMVDGQ